MVVDEVQTGFGRTGKMFAIENFNIVPDIMTVAKALGNGTPISAFIATAQIADSYVKPGASTLGGNPVSSTAALATLDYIDSENLISKATERGQQLFNGLKTLQDKHQIIGDIRGLGLMRGAELIHADKTPASAETDFILEEMKNLGFIIGKNGTERNVLAFQPPLIITEDNINEMLNALDLVLGKIK